MRGFKRDHTARVIMRRHGLTQNVRRGHYELGINARPHCRVATIGPHLRPPRADLAAVTVGKLVFAICGDRSHGIDGFLSQGVEALTVRSMP